MMDFLGALRLLGRHWVLLVVCAVLGGAAAHFYTSRQEPKYAASVTMFVSASDRDGSASSAYQASLLSRDRIKSYATLLGSDRLVDRVGAELKLPAERLRAALHAEVVPDTVLLRATVLDSSPEQARRIADSAGDAFAALIADLERPAKGEAPTVRATVVDHARPPAGPVSPRPLTNLALGLLAGLAVGIGGALLREAFDTSVKTSEELAGVAGVRTLGVIGYDSVARRTPIITDGAGHSRRAESFRSLRTNLQFAELAGGGDVRRVVFTSSLPKEGKSTTVCNLALALAQAGRSVIIVDGDLRRPRLAAYLGLECREGLSDVLAGRREVASVLRPWGGLPLQVLASGPVPHNPSELLGSDKMRRVLEHLTDLADVVLVDAPPLLPVTDAALIARHCDGAVMITRCGRTTREQLAQAASQLRAVNVKILGGVLTMAPQRRESGYGYIYPSVRDYTTTRV